ncbi:MAG: 6-phosphofructokinase [Anaerolineae bacterium]|nr:6-phosphofructokinase [Anaerolineae bacterium]
MKMKKIGVLTSGGDAPGMNAAVRAVVRAGIASGAEVYAIYEGYQGMVDGQGMIRRMAWQDVGGILYKGGTLIGTARCNDFRERHGRLRAARNLLEHGINNLVVIGGDGSLTGANIFRQEWPSLLDELVERGELPYDLAQQHRELTIVGLVGSIDNDMWGTDISIGADTALHRITDAVDAISSTAASHQRSFVVEVMGRRCGYLALMSAIATGADWVLIPEAPPNLDEWENKMCAVLKNGRENGRRDSIVIVAEGARDRYGNEITCGHVKQVLEDRLQEDARITILGHVQRGGSPSAFDRNLSTLMGAAAVDTIMSDRVVGQATLIGLKGNKITHTPLEECLQKTKAIDEAIKTCNFERAMELRGSGFREAFQTVRTLVRAIPHDPLPGQKQRRIAVINSGAPAPGMNTAVRAAVRLGLDKGHAMFGIYNGFSGFAEDEMEELNWMSVNGWAYLGGSELGTNRHVPANSDFYKIARSIEENNIEGLLIIGGWSAYVAALELYQRRNNYPAFNIPIVCFPATIDNDLPGAELSVGADSALNSIIDAIDKIKQSAVASRRVFVVEVMGEKCGYLALMSALATGAERVYLHEEGMRLTDLAKDVESLVSGFKEGKRLGVIIRSEGANETYTTDFMCALLEEEGGDYFTARKAVLGHMQQGGNPTPFDRILATRLAAKCINYLEEQIGAADPGSAAIGLQSGSFRFTEFHDMERLMDMDNRRPKHQWWMELRPIARTMSSGRTYNGRTNQPDTLTDESSV